MPKSRAKYPRHLRGKFSAKRRAELRDLHAANATKARQFDEINTPQLELDRRDAAAWRKYLEDGGIEGRLNGYLQQAAMAECTVEVTEYAGEVRCTMAFPDRGPVVTRTLGRRGFETQEATTNRVMALCTAAGVSELEYRREQERKGSCGNEYWRTAPEGRVVGLAGAPQTQNDALKPPPNSYSLPARR